MKGDVQIHRDIAEELEWDPQLRGMALGIAVKEGVVTLSGTVDTYLQKLAAQHAVQRVAGVRAVADELDVKPPSLFARSDTDIAHAAVSALARSAHLDAKRIKVELLDGKVTLKGQVHSWAERRDAERAAWSAPGVRLVEDQLVVTA
jgi:osmotically-inducible protein OsmY